MKFKENEVCTEIPGKDNCFFFAWIKMRKRRIFLLHFFHKEPLWATNKPFVDLVWRLWRLQFVEDRLRNNNLPKEFRQNLSQSGEDQIMEWSRVGNDNHFDKTRSSVARSCSKSASS